MKDPFKVCGIAGYSDRSEKHYGCPGKITPELAQLVVGVKKHALENYDSDGWDILVETYEDKEIVEVIEKCTDLACAIKHIGEQIGVIADVRSDVWGSGGLCPTCATVEPEDCVHRKTYKAGDIVYWRAEEFSESGPTGDLTIHAGTVLNANEEHVKVGDALDDGPDIEIKRKWLVNVPNVPF